ncbi:MAG: protein kinase [Planctomycetia bacterium]|nr:protein kinase [Planctomycetia bacterium]
MSSSKVDEICRLLVRLQLVPQHQIDICLGQLGKKNSQTEDVLKWFEHKGLLTSYQVGRIEKGEIDGLVLGNYKLMYRNASGSFARVYRACDLRSGRMVGLKVLRQRWTEDPKAVAEFRREAELGKALKHENIVPIYEVGQSNGQHYLSMEFVEGGNLRDFINIRKKLTPQEATKCVLDMASGLDYAFSRGSTHRDLKMTNVLMSSQGVAKLVDFGLAGVAEDKRDDGESAQRALEYATLEKNTGAPRNDPRSDMYFLGAIYYELLTGIPPLPRTKDRLERSQFSRYQQVRPLRDVEPGLPRTITAVVERMMQLNPAMRFQTPAESLPLLRATYADLCQGRPEMSGETQPDTTRPTTSTAPGPMHTIMCIEDRHKNQDFLREYFSKHGFRVLVLSDIQRGLARLKSSPPDCMVIMGESLGDRAVNGFNEAQALLERSQSGVVLVLGEKQSAMKSRISETETARVLVQPVTLRDLRKVVKRTIGESNNGDDTEPGDNGQA